MRVSAHGQCVPKCTMKCAVNSLCPFLFSFLTTLYLWSTTPGFSLTHTGQEAVDQSSHFPTSTMGEQTHCIHRCCREGMSRFVIAGREPAAVHWVLHSGTEPGRRCHRLCQSQSDGRLCQHVRLLPVACLRPAAHGSHLADKRKLLRLTLRSFNWWAASCFHLLVALQLVS